MEDKMENKHFRKDLQNTDPSGLNDLNENILVGVFHHDTKGILLVQRYSDRLQLPGGLIKKENDSRKSFKQSEKEKDEIQRFILEKTGFTLKVKNKFVAINVENQPRSYIAFYLELIEVAGEQNWYRNKSFRYLFLKPEKIKTHPNIKEEDRQIIFYYLMHEKAIKAKPYSPFAPIITIAL